jgi:hypothetical protein
MNYREIINRVCRVTGDELVECSATELTSDRHIQIGEFLNQVKDEIEGSHNWRALRSFVTVVPAADVGIGIFSENIPRNSRIIRIHDAHNGQLVPLAWDISVPAQPVPLREVDLSVVQYKLATAGPLQNTYGEPQIFSLSPTGATLTSYTWPVCQTSRILYFGMTCPQAYLDVDDVGQEVYIPARALLMGTIWYTLQERGEELGAGSMYTEERYRAALDADIAIDAAEQGEYELVPV